MSRYRKWILIAVTIILLICIAFISGGIKRVPTIIFSFGYRVYLPTVLYGWPILPVKKGVASSSERCDPKLAVGAKYHRSWWVQTIQCPGIEGIGCVGNAFIASKVLDGIWELGTQSEYVLGFNEPEDPEQANMTIEEAVPLWHALRTKFPDRLWVSPSTWTTDNDWLERFYDLYTATYPGEVPFNVVDFHCYENDGQSCIERGEYFVGLAQKWEIGEVWCSEFSFWGKDNVENAKQFIDWMDCELLITRYFWYTDECKPYTHWCWVERNLVVWQSDPIQLTELGKMYHDRVLTCSE